MPANASISATVRPFRVAQVKFVVRCNLVEWSKRLKTLVDFIRNFGATSGA